MSDNLVYTTAENVSLNNETASNNNTNTNTNTTTTTNTTTAPPLTLSPNVITLKEAFPDIDVEIIEVVLQNHQNNVEASFESLLHISDPNYQSPPPPSQQQQQQQQQPTVTSSQQYGSNDPSAPPKPPRPGQPISPEEQLRLDEEFAKRLALEDERQRIYDHQLRQQRQQQSQQQHQQQQQEDKDGFDEFIKEIQDEIPVIKEKVIEAGNVAKKKVLDMYNQFKASRANNGNGGSGSNSLFGSSSSGSMPVSNAQYRGLPSDRDDDYLLSDDMTALHLSDQDVYAQTGARGNQRTNNNKNYYDYQGSDFQAHETIVPSNVIHVNPSPHSQQYKTTTSEAQILADEEFARQLAQNDEIWRQQQQQQQSSPPAMPPRQPSNIQSNLNTNNNNNNRLSNPSVVVVAPKSPLEEFDERDNAVSKKDEDINVKSYVIGDDDDSEDGLVDLDDDDEDEDTKNQSQKPNQKTSDSPKIDTK
ncbi:hypothetical protein BJ944DRAFT_41350 [Cunninghamella echinulata]|nr:hypothetical protein BJ944DRAFT_41350 [Cunninghamella echinulata]